MKKRTGIILPILLLALIIIVIYRLDDITNLTMWLINPEPKVVISKPNEYSNDNDYMFVQKSHDFIPLSRQDIMNIFYSFLDNGYENFTFYCPSEYTDCTNDIIDIINNQTLITDISNFVHPFNSFHDVNLTTSSTGEVNLSITKTYDVDRINAINRKIDKIFEEIFNDDMDTTDKILAIHDYIIDNTEYDVDGLDDLTSYDLLFFGKSKCAGYADTMSIMLNRLGIKNYKVGSNQHVWNAIYLDGTWSHIDVTWDDPIVENGAKLTNNIRHKFYMIDTETLLSYDTKEHNFNDTIYRELRQ